jgi:glycosyltransferase involved in cell wall biosynthesis
MAKGEKVKVLFVVMDFWQAGAERFAFEVDSSLNKDLFDVTILCVRNLNESVDFPDYYYKEHLKLNTHIVFLETLVGESKIATRIKRRIPALNRNKKSKRLNGFFSQFPVINWFGEYAYSFLCEKLEDSIARRSVIHIMNARFQGPSFYENFPKGQKYIFTSGFDDEEQVKYEFADIEDYEHVLFPLHLNLHSPENNWKFKDKAKKKIGVFTRLSAMKPLDPFVYAFHLLLDRMPDIELHIFGSGDPVIAGFDKYIRHLSLQNKVFFRGHQEDIVKTAVNEELDLVWFQGYKNRPAGYAGFDICRTGIPQVLWDFNPSPLSYGIGGNVYPIYKHLTSFVDKSYQVLTDEKEAMSLSSLQFNDLLENRDMQKKIYVLENLFLNIAETTSRNP